MVFSNREKCQSVISTLNGFLRPLLFSPMTTVLKKKKKCDAAQADSAYFETWNSEKPSAARIDGIFFCTPLHFFKHLVRYDYFPMSALCTLKKKKYIRFRRVLKADYYSYNIAICWITNAPTMPSAGQSKFTVIRELFFVFYSLRFNDVEG